MCNATCGDCGNVHIRLCDQCDTTSPWFPRACGWWSKSGKMSCPSCCRLREYKVDNRLADQHLCAYHAREFQTNGVCVPALVTKGIGKGKCRGSSDNPAPPPPPPLPPAEDDPRLKGTLEHMERKDLDEFRKFMIEPQSPPCAASSASSPPPSAPLASRSTACPQICDDDDTPRRHRGVDATTSTSGDTLRQLGWKVRVANIGDAVKRLCPVCGSTKSNAWRHDRESKVIICNGCFCARYQHNENNNKCSGGTQVDNVE